MMNANLTLERSLREEFAKTAASADDLLCFLSGRVVLMVFGYIFLGGKMDMG